MRAAQRRELEALRARVDGALDGDLVARYAALLEATPAAAQVDLAGLAPSLGSLGQADHASRRFASAGSSWPSGRRLRVEGTRFDDLFQGPAALAAWLRANGCSDPRYEFAAAADENGLDPL